MPVGPLTWELCTRSNQAILATLSPQSPDDSSHVPGARVEIARHVARLAEIHLALDDPAADLVSVGDTLIRCKAAGWSQPLFVGRVNTVAIDESGDGETLGITAADPLTQLETAYVLELNTAFDPDVYAYAEYLAIQQTTIMADLISDTADNGHGVVIGTTPASVTRTLSFPAGSSVVEGLLAVTALENGPEFELTPKEATNGELATFNAYHPRQGSDKSATVIFKLGVSDKDNLLGLSYEEQLAGMCNRFLAIGDSNAIATKGGLEYPRHPAYEAAHAASIAAYGAVERSEAISGVTDAAALEAYAKGIVSANSYPIKSFSISLDPDGDLDFGPAEDCWMGDTIALQAVLPEEALSLTGRIAAASLTEDEDGVIDVELDCEVIAASGVTGTATNVVMDAGDGTAPTPPETPSGKKGGKGGKTKKKKKKK